MLTATDRTRTDPRPGTRRNQAVDEIHPRPRLSCQCRQESLDGRIVCEDAVPTNDACRTPKIASENRCIGVGRPAYIQRYLGTFRSSVLCGNEACGSVRDADSDNVTRRVLRLSLSMSLCDSGGPYFMIFSPVCILRLLIFGIYGLE